jgi:hypothetical protein
MRAGRLGIGIWAGRLGIGMRAGRFRVGMRAGRLSGHGLDVVGVRSSAYLAVVAIAAGAFLLARLSRGRLRLFAADTAGPSCSSASAAARTAPTATGTPTAGLPATA